MNKPIGLLCLLGLVGSLLAADYLALAPPGSPPLAAAQHVGGITQTASNGSAPSLLFADDFERGTGNWDLNANETGSWEVRTENSNQVLHGAAFATADPGTAWDDYRVIEARARVANSDSEAKIAFRVGEQAAGYYLGLGGDGVLRLDKWDGADWTHLGSDPGPYPTGDWVLLALEGEGSQLRAYLDGKLKIEASDAAYASGSLMLNVPFGEADFDDAWAIGDAPAACPVVPSNGLNAPFGIAFNSQGKLFVGSAGSVKQVTGEGEVVFFAPAGAPPDLAVDDNDNLYAVDEVDDVIYKIAPDGTRTDFVTSLSAPFYIAIGLDGYLYANDDADIMRIDLDDGSVSLWMVGVGGDAMAFDAAGNLYLSSDKIARITPDRTVSLIATLPRLPSKFYRGIALDRMGNIYVGETVTFQSSETDPPWVPPAVADKVYKITPDGQVSTFASGLGGVWNLAFGPDGYLYVTEHDSNGLSKIAPDGTMTPIVPCNGLSTVADVIYGPDDLLYFASTENSTVSRLDAQRQAVAAGTGFGLCTGEARGPALAFNVAGELFVAEPCSIGPQRITKIASDTATVFTHDIEGPSGLAFDASGDVYVSEGPLGNVVRFSPDGTRHSFASGLSQPQGLTFGPDGLLYVAEIGGDQVSQIDASGTVTPFVTLTWPIDLVFLGDDLLVSTETGEIWRVDPAGTATRFATGPSNAGGITLNPNGDPVVAFGADNSIYRFTEGGTTPSVGVTAPSRVGLGQPGQVVTHTFTVHNVGNGRDGFWLAADSKHGWPVEVQGGAFVGPVECGQARSVQVAVTVPTGTAPGITDALTLTATSRLSPSASASAQGTTISSYGIYLPLILTK